MSKKPPPPPEFSSPLTRNEKRILRTLDEAAKHVDDARALVRGRYLESHKWTDRGDHWDPTAISSAANRAIAELQKVGRIETADYEDYADSYDDDKAVE